ncbi:MAG: hypothetical protein NTV46_21185 [Verrucomicrobia bacterium]|nr:hypothetical protein [Verrucomicrobiota bacterium]
MAWSAIQAESAARQSRNCSSHTFCSGLSRSSRSTYNSRYSCYTRSTCRTCYTRNTRCSWDSSSGSAAVDR